MTWAFPNTQNIITQLFLYNPSTNKYLKKSIHINRVKPCFQRDDIPEDDEVIAEMPIVEVTFPLIAPPIQQPQTLTEEIKTPEGRIIPDITNNDSPHIIIPATQNHTDNTSTDTQHGSLDTNDGDENNLPYHDANKYWNALKIKRQRTVKGKIQYLIK